ncbi:MAG: hypothetical protein HQL65_13290, partial [Magnetococcales bacterium]|nr:hypothetical protein [Magnetococcales bacterium]
SKGAFLPRDRRVILIASALDNEADARTTIRHETIGHFGLNLLAPGGKDRVYRQIQNSKSDPTLQKIWQSVEKGYPELNPQQQAEEVFASIAERAKDIGGVRVAWNRIKATLRNGLRTISFIDEKTTEIELEELAQTLAHGIRSGWPQRIFPKDNASQFIAPSSEQSVAEGEATDATVTN